MDQILWPMVKSQISLILPCIKMACLNTDKNKVRFLTCFPSCVFIVDKQMQSIMLNKISPHFLLEMVLTKIRHSNLILLTMCKY